MKYQTSVIRERPGVDGSEEEIPITVECSFVHASGDGWNEPHEPAHWEIEYADDAAGNDIPLTDAEIQYLCNELKERSYAD